MKTSEVICLAILAAMAGWYGKTEYDKLKTPKSPQNTEGVQGLQNGFIKRRL